MGLSEREQQLLDEMERRLYQSEADVMQTPASNARLNMRSLVLGIVVVLVGMALLVSGVAIQQLWLGVIGFAVMLGGALLGFSKREAVVEPEAPGGSPRPGAKVGRESLSDRMERRWEQRMDGEL